MDNSHRQEQTTLGAELRTPETVTGPLVGNKGGHTERRKGQENTCLLVSPRPCVFGR